MIEADVMMDANHEQVVLSSTYPAPATIDLPLTTLLLIVDSHPSTKGIKLDFKEPQAVGPALQVWLHKFQLSFCKTT